MGTDYRLYTPTASLDLDVRGQDLFNALNGTVLNPGIIRQGTLTELPGFDRKMPFWKGIWGFLRDHGGHEGMVVSEHSELYDQLYTHVTPALRFALTMKKGRGYEPVR